MNKQVLVAALGAAMAGMGGLAGPSVEVVRREPGYDLSSLGGRSRTRGYSGRQRSNRVKVNRIEAYKRQRAANRLRRKLEARRG